MSEETHSASDSHPLPPSSGSRQTDVPRLISGLRTVSGWTLLSRVLGLIRDVGMAALFGNGAVLDAFSVAFRIPNLARRLFGEGALTASFLPVFVRELEHDRNSAWRLATALLTILTITLCGGVLAGEALLYGLSQFRNTAPETQLLLELTAVLLPYVILICLAAQFSAALHALNHFTWPALLPVLLNVIWIGAIWLIAPQIQSPAGQVHAISICIVAAGFVQLAAPWWRLRRFGFRYQPDWRSAMPQVRAIGRAMLPVLVGLSITQLNTLADSLIAWSFSRPVSLPAGAEAVGSFAYPLEAGTASALYFGQRLYQFPLGVFGVALGTVLFPLLSRHAADGRLDRLRDDLSFGLRLVILIGLPASAGLFLLGTPLTKLLFQHGAFDAADTAQTGRMIAAYGLGVWAYCGLLILHRGYYAMGDRQTPLQIGLVAVGVNLILDFTLIWPWGGVGLAVGTAITAMMQVAAITWFVQARIGRLDWKGLFRTAWRAVLATTVMMLIGGLALYILPASDDWSGRLSQVCIPLTVCVLVYFAAARLLHLDDLWLLFRRNRSDS